MLYRPVLASLVLASALAMSGCTGLMAAGSALGAVAGVIGTANQVAATVDPMIATACHEYDKGKAAADALVAAGLVATDAAAKVKSVEVLRRRCLRQPAAGGRAVLGDLARQARRPARHPDRAGKAIRLNRGLPVIPRLRMLAAARRGASTCDRGRVSALRRSPPSS